MSRSYRKPWYTDGYKGSLKKRYFKRYANKIIRKTDDIPEGKAYRKYFDSWNICDYRFLYNPYPRIVGWGGTIQIFEPQPYWRVGRK